jgi:hypothetical protein
MIYISHRGNVDGKKPHLENKPEYIDEAISLGYDVEIDVWCIDGGLMLGHDEPQYRITKNWLKKRYDNVWVHCKNIEALELFNALRSYHYFWHEEDTVTLTSRGVVWAYPGKQPIKGSIAVMPERGDDDVSICIGICSDVIKKYKDEITQA